MQKSPLSTRDQALRAIVHAGEASEADMEQQFGAAIITDLLEKGDVARKKQGLFSRGPSKLVATRQGQGKESEF
jgi:hypothetical protein